jgi:hypothetical protein
MEHVVDDKWLQGLQRNDPALGGRTKDVYGSTQERLTDWHGHHRANRESGGRSPHTAERSAIDDPRTVQMAAGN